MSKKKVNRVEHINLGEIKDPSFLKNLSYKELDVLASDIRQEIIRCTAKNGGHLSSNLGVVELTIAIEHFFDLSKDKLIFDVGHQCYTHKILTGRPLETLRQTNGVSGFQKIDESVYDCFDAGHSSTSISAANGFAIARDLKGENYNVIAVIGDGSIPSGLAFEGLNNIGSGNHKVVIILNDNGMSISKPVGALSKRFGKISTAAGYNRIKYGYRKAMFKTKVGKKIYNLSLRIKNWFKRHLTSENLFTNLGFAYIGPIDGHNIRKLEKAFKRVSNTDKSVVVHVCTTKGKGYELAENDSRGSWHGVAPFKIQDGVPLKSSNHESWSKVFADISLKEMEIHQDAFLISPATTVGAEMEEVLKRFPERSLDVGIAEEHAATLSGGLSHGGFHPIISIYSTFMQRAYDEIAHDLARTKSNATLLIDRAGLVGRDGETHQGIYDAAFLSTIPGVVISMPSTRKEAEYLYEESFNNHGVFAIRYPRATCLLDGEEPEQELSFGKWIKVREGHSKKVAVIATGHLVHELDNLVKEQNVDCTIYNAIFINPLDEDALKSLLSYDKIVIYDAYSTQGGLVSAVTLKLSQLKFKGLISAHFVPNVFVKQASVKEQLESFGLLPEQIIEDLK